jgi:hypothetical protein
MKLVVTCQEPIGGTLLNINTILGNISRSLWPQLSITTINVRKDEDFDIWYNAQGQPANEVHYAATKRAWFAALE